MTTTATTTKTKAVDMVRVVARRGIEPNHNRAVASTDTVGMARVVARRGVDPNHNRAVASIRP